MGCVDQGRGNQSSIEGGTVALMTLGGHPDSHQGSEMKAWMRHGDYPDGQEISAGRIHVRSKQSFGIDGSDFSSQVRGEQASAVRMGCSH